MTMFKFKKLYFPAAVIVAIILTLLVFIGFSTYWNMNQARTNALKFVHQQGMSTLQILEAGVLSILEMPDFQKQSIDRLMRESGNNQNIEFVYIADRDGRIMHSSRSPQETPSDEWIKQAPKNQNVFYHIAESPGKMPIYEMAQRIRTLDGGG